MPGPLHLFLEQVFVDFFLVRFAEEIVLDLPYRVRLGQGLIVQGGHRILVRFLIDPDVFLQAQFFQKPDRGLLDADTRALAVTENPERDLYGFSVPEQVRPVVFRIRPQQGRQAGDTLADGRARFNGGGFNFRTEPLSSRNKPPQQRAENRQRLGQEKAQTHRLCGESHIAYM
jgi:hypothetical protein